MAHPEDSRVDAAKRLIAAPAGAVYRALLDPKALARWLPPAGMAGRVDAFDPRPGGAFEMTLFYEDEAISGKSGAGSDVFKGRFVALSPEKEVVQAVVFVSEDPAFAGEMTMRWTLTPAAGGTEVAVACRNVPAGIGAADHARGLASTLENLARDVE